MLKDGEILKNPGVSVIVEFIGAPGSGKSTLAQKAAAQFRKSGYKVTEYTSSVDTNRFKVLRFFTKCRLTLSFLMKNPRNTLHSVSFIRKSQQQNLFDDLILIFNYLFLSETIKRLKHQNGLHFLDHGYFQAVLAILQRAGNKKIVADQLLCDKMNIFKNTNIIIIFLNCDTASLVARLQNRKTKKGRIDKQPGVKLIDELEASAGNVRFIKKIVADLKAANENVHVFEIANNDEQSLDDNVRRIVDIIAPLTGEP